MTDANADLNGKGHDDWIGLHSLAKENAVTVSEARRIARARGVSSVRKGKITVYDPDEFEAAIAEEEQDGQDTEAGQQSRFINMLENTNKQLLASNELLQKAVKDREAHIQQLYSLIPGPHEKLMASYQAVADRYEQRVTLLEAGHDKLMKDREQVASEAHARELGDRMWKAENDRKNQIFAQFIQPGAGMLIKQLVKSLGLGGLASTAAPAASSGVAASSRDTSKASEAMPSRADNAGNAAPDANAGNAAPGGEPGNAATAEASGNAAPASAPATGDASVSTSINDVSAAPPETPESLLARDGAPTPEELDQIDAVGILVRELALRGQVDLLAKHDLIDRYQESMIRRIVKEPNDIEAARLLLRTSGLGVQLDALVKFGLASDDQKAVIQRILNNAPKSAMPKEEGK